MWRARLIVLLLCLLPLSRPGFAHTPPTLPYRDARLPTSERVRDLLSRMTLEEKFWQLYMIPGDLDDPADDYSHGIFGLQISTAPRTRAAADAGGTMPASEIARRHAVRLRGEFVAR